MTSPVEDAATGSAGGGGDAVAIANTVLLDSTIDEPEGEADLPTPGPSSEPVDVSQDITGFGVEAACGPLLGTNDVAEPDSFGALTGPCMGEERVQARGAGEAISRYSVEKRRRGGGEGGVSKRLRRGGEVLVVEGELVSDEGEPAGAGCWDTSHRFYAEKVGACDCLSSRDISDKSRTSSMT